VGGLAGGLAGGFHAQISGDDPLQWAQIGQALGGIVGSYSGGSTFKSNASRSIRVNNSISDYSLPEGSSRVSDARGLVAVACAAVIGYILLKYFIIPELENDFKEIKVNNLDIDTKAINSTPNNKIGTDQLSSNGDSCYA